MPAITYDAQSLLLDGRREWLVSATLPYASHPREEWGARIADAADAGFNCLLVPCVWGAHETRRGTWDFAAGHDLRAFLLLVRKAGLRAILRVGPYVGAPWDMGGIPAWVGASTQRSQTLANREGLVAASQAHWSGLRAGTPEFLEATSRWYAALAEQTRDQQFTVHARAPVVGVQIEHEWLCAHEIVADGYLGELARFAREAGFSVPLLNCNNLHAGAEGDIDAWSGGVDALATARQLAGVRPDQPPMLLELGPGPAPSWGAAPPAQSAVDLQATLAGALAGGAQFNLSRFAPGSVQGFGGGRSGDAPDAFFCPAPDEPLSALADGGARGQAYHLVKRLATFASSFGRVFANRDATRAASMLAPGPAGPTLGHVAGARGSVDIVIGPEAGATHHVIAADGSSHSVHTGDQRVTWRLERLHLHGRVTLDYCDACAFALVGRAFVCFGPAGERAALSINGGPFEVVFPEGKAPTIEEHDGMTLVVCNEEQIDAAVAAPDAVHIGVAGLTDGREPVAHPEFRTRLRVGADGAVERVNQGAGAKPVRTGRAPALSAWEVSRCDEQVAGESVRYAGVTGPARLDALGAAAGYGWMRLRFSGASARSVKAALLECADRAHVYLDGEALGVVGAGPGASRDPLTVAIKKREHTMTFLVENLGRAAGGSTMGEPKGLWGAPAEVSPLRPGAPTMEVGAPLSPLEFRSPLMGVRETDRTDPHRLTWAFQRRRKTAIAVCVEDFGAPALLVVNGKVVEFLDHADRPRVILADEALKTGKNTVALAFLTDHGGAGSAEDAAKAMRTGVRFFEIEGPVAPKGTWAFAKWEAPPAKSFAAPGKAALAGVPAWWRATFEASGASLFLDLTGLTKGQVFLNGRNLSRYFVATASGKSVAGQKRVRLPGAWLKASGANEVTLFDEHGASPAKTRLQTEPAPK